MRADLWSWLLRNELLASHSLTMAGLIYFAVGLSLASFVVVSLSCFAISRGRRKMQRQMEILNGRLREVNGVLMELRAERQNIPASDVWSKPAGIESEHLRDERKRALGGLKNELLQLRDQMSKNEMTREAAE